MAVIVLYKLGDAFASALQTAFLMRGLVGKNASVLTAAVVIENVTGGMGTAAFVALVMSLCDLRYTATQFALLSSLEALGRVFAGRPSADVVTLIGWTQFFILTVVVALPGLWAIWRIRHSIEPERKNNAHVPALKPAVPPASE